MPDLSIPLVNRGAEALEALLNYDHTAADAAVRLLTMSELTYLSIAARELAALAGTYLNKACGVCGGAIVWDADEPTRQQSHWRHVDQAASYLAGAHRAAPVPGSHPGEENQ